MSARAAKASSHDAGLDRGDVERRALRARQRLARHPRANQATPALWPRAPRHSPIGAIVLTNGDMDHVLGLFSLRESQPLALYARRRCGRASRRACSSARCSRFEGQVVFRPLAIGEDGRAARCGGRAARPTRASLRGAGQAAGASRRSCRGERRGQRRPLAARCRREGRAALAYAAACASVDGVDARRLTTPCSSTARSSARTSSSARPLEGGREGHGARAHRRRGRQPRAPRVACAARKISRTSTTRTPSSRPIRGAPRGRSRRLGDRVRRDGDHADDAMTERRRAAPRRAKRSSRASAPRARSATTTAIRSTSRMHAGKLSRGRSRLGAEPLLLPDADPHQGRHHPLEVGGPRVPSRVDAPHLDHDGKEDGEGGLAQWLRSRTASGSTSTR